MPVTVDYDDRAGLVYVDCYGVVTLDDYAQALDRQIHCIARHDARLSIEDLSLLTASGDGVPELFFTEEIMRQRHWLRRMHHTIIHPSKLDGSAILSAMVARAGIPSSDYMISSDGWPRRLDFVGGFAEP